MGNKVQYVDILLNRTLWEYCNPEFYSEHSEDDIRGWLNEKEDDPHFWEKVGEEEGWDHDLPDEVEVRNISFSEQVLNSVPYCEYDDEIQEWIDRKPERKRKEKVRTFLRSIDQIHQRHVDDIVQFRKLFIEDPEGREFLKDPSSFVRGIRDLSDEKKMDIQILKEHMKMIGLDSEIE